MAASGNPAKKAEQNKAAVERAKAEAARKKALDEADDALGAVKVKLTGRKATRTIEVQPFMDWADDWREHLGDEEAGAPPNFRGWARSVLDEENLAKWVEAAPSQRQAMTFFNAWEDNAGEDLGESDSSQDS